MKDAARRANAHAFVEQLPEVATRSSGSAGSSSPAASGSASASPAILADPQILILDEATSNLDTESEQLIRVARRPVRGPDRVRHRPPVEHHQAQDLIVVMDEGRIKETGTHEC